MMSRSTVWARLKSRTRLPVVVLVDVDGTLVGPYHRGRRELRRSAPVALAMLSEVAPVFLWSIAGSDNGDRLQQEFPEIGSLVMGSFGKHGFPLDLVDTAYAIDDEGIDAPVTRCRYVLLDRAYWGGAESDDLVRAAELIVAELRPQART